MDNHAAIRLKNPGFRGLFFKKYTVKFTSDNHVPAEADANNADTGMKKKARLTKRERQVLEIVAQGMTTAEIAVKLFVSAETVESHRKNITKKLKAKNMVNAAVKAMRKGWLK